MKHAQVSHCQEAFSGELKRADQVKPVAASSRVQKDLLGGIAGGRQLVHKMPTKTPYLPFYCRVKAGGLINLHQEQPLETILVCCLRLTAASLALGKTS